MIQSMSVVAPANLTKAGSWLLTNAASAAASSASEQQADGYGQITDSSAEASDTEATSEGTTGAADGTDEVSPAAGGAGTTGTTGTAGGSSNAEAANAVTPLTATAAASALKLVTQENIAAGAKRIDYLWTTTRNSRPARADVHVIEIDLTNPYVKLDVMSGKNNTVGSVNTVMNMAKENGAVGAINADVFIMGSEGSPMGSQISKGAMISSPMQLRGMFAFGITKDRKPTIDRYNFDGKITTDAGLTYPLAGINQSAYNPESTPDTAYSHVDAMYIYNSAWAGAERPRGSSTTPTEVLVRNNVVEKISDGKPLPDKPPADGYILRSHGKAAKFVRDNMKAGQVITAAYSLISQTSGNKIDPASYDMMVGGHTILVDKGQPSYFSRDINGVSGNSYRSRSSVGYSQDGTKVYLITTEDYGDSTGMTLKELQKVMVQLGVYQGINLDGGGSTTMIERPLAETGLTLAHPTEYGSSMRSVANAIGVFSSAPQGQLKGVKVSGSRLVFIGGTASYTAKGYDTYYNPIAATGAQVKWGVDNTAVGTMNGNVFTGRKPGKANITVQYGGTTTKQAVEVVGQDQIAAMTIDAGSAILAKGATLSTAVTVKLKNGSSYKLSGSSLTWEYVGFKATNTGSSITIDSVDAGAKNGYAIARYDGYGTMVPLTTGGTLRSVETFEKPAYGITSQATPATTKGSVSLVTDLEGSGGSKALQISYDFKAGTGTKAAYAIFNGTSGVPLSGSPKSLSMDVYGDNSLNWLRAEMTDADGKAHLVTIAKQVDWSGKKQVKVDLSSYAMKYPVKLKKIYIVTIEEGWDERALTGAVAIDNITQENPPSVTEPARAVVTMNIGSKTATVNGKALALETAPILEKGTTYVPIRFVADSMGSKVMWDGKAYRVSVLRGSKLLELVIGRKDIVVNGVRRTSDVAPMIRGGRTLVPIRLISEQFGLEVSYEEKTKKITIQ
ncbi:stalk domain-containing protein [Paenibacillus sp. GCM10023252]|uniref:stalk domain-containing protein n=1 Tax=Paenibacillus sp. GCM10023252 TaxID=3252649 RepID=UPI003617F657